MAGINKAILIGHLGRDPELRYIESGSAVCNFSLATSESWNDKSGEKQERTEWHRVVCWEKLAEICAEHLSKGRQVYVEGQLQTRKWEDREGNERYTTEIKARTVQFLGSKGDAPAGEKSQRESDQTGGGDAGGDIPFSPRLW